jgi:hypothetical protein
MKALSSPKENQEFFEEGSKLSLGNAKSLSGRFSSLSRNAKSSLGRVLNPLGGRPKLP